MSFRPFGVSSREVGERVVLAEPVAERVCPHRPRHSRRIPRPLVGELLGFGPADLAELLLADRGDDLLARVAAGAASRHRATRVVRLPFSGPLLDRDRAGRDRRADRAGLGAIGVLELVECP